MTRARLATTVSIALTFVGFLCAALLGAAMMVQRAHTTWSDGMGLRVPLDSARGRDVIWRPPERVRAVESTDVDEYEPRASPDGTMLVFVHRRPDANADLFLSRWTPEGWTAPCPIDDLNTDADELAPEFSADGRTLWFASNREGGAGGFDLWFARQSDDGGWSLATNAGSGVNTPFDEYGTALARDGKRIYFASNRPRPDEAPSASDDQSWPATMRERKHRHDHDLYGAALDVDLPGAAERIAALSTPFDEGAPALSPAGDFLYFASDRPDGAGGFDLYRARLVDGAAQLPERLDDTVNSPANELDPALAAEGFRLFFSSDREAIAVAPGEEATYALWTSRSCEVFRDEPSIASAIAGVWSATWPWLLLGLLALAALLLLVSILRLVIRNAEWRRRFLRLNLFAKCLLLSLILHAFAAMLFAVWRVGVHVGDAIDAGGDRVVLASGDGDGGFGEVVATVSLAEDIDIAPASPVDALRPDAALFSLSVASDERDDVAVPNRSTVSEVALSERNPASAVLELSVPESSASRVETATPRAPEAAMAKATPSIAPSFAVVAQSAPAIASPPDAPTRDATPAMTRPTLLLESVALPAPNVALLAPAPIEAGALLPRAAPAPALERESAPQPVRVATVPSALGAGAVSRGIAPSTVKAANDVVGLPARATASRDVKTDSAGAATPAAPIASGASPLALATPRAATPTMESEPSATASSAGSIAVPTALAARTPTSATTSQAAGDVGALPSRAAQSGNSEGSVANTALPAAPTATGTGTIATALPKAAAPTESHAGASDSAAPRLASGEVLRPQGESSSPRATPGDDVGPSLPRATQAPRVADAPTNINASIAAARPRDAQTNPGASLGLGLGLHLPVKPGEAPPPVETFEQRDRESRGRLLDRGGGSADTERAVGRALDWFQRVQSSDGHWSSRNLEGKVDADAAMTGLALLSYLGAGHTHIAEGPYRESVERGLRWLVLRQSADGDLRGGRSGGDSSRDSMYGQTIATVALCEAYSMTRDPVLAGPARRAVDLVIAASRNPRDRDADTSVLGWLIMTVESARRAGFEPPPDVFAAARSWLDTIAMSQARGRYAYQSGGSPEVGMTAEAMFVQQILGHNHNESRMQQSADFLLTSMPRWTNDAPTHSWYYATLALFQHQGDAWNRWNEALAPLLVKHQRGDGTFEGSWDPQDHWSQLCGRVYQTAICTLSLEVYYRYRVSDGVGAARAPRARVPKAD